VGPSEVKKKEKIFKNEYLKKKFGLNSNMKNIYLEFKK
jgi:hypothetical protein